MPESKVLTLVDAFRVERAKQNLLHKLARRETGQRSIEGQHNNRVDAGFSQQPQTLVERRDELRRAIGTKRRGATGS